MTICGFCLTAVRIPGSSCRSHSATTRPRKSTAPSAHPIASLPEHCPLATTRSSDSAWPYDSDACELIEYRPAFVLSEGNPMVAGAPQTARPACRFRVVRACRWLWTTRLETFSGNEWLQRRCHRRHHQRTSRSDQRSHATLQFGRPWPPVALGHDAGGPIPSVGRPTPITSLGDEGRT